MLEEKVNVLEKSINTLRSQKPETVFKCDQCPYEATSTTALKSHMIKKHKAEQLRKSSTSQDLEVSPEKEAPRAADPSSTLKSTVASSMENTCHICNKYFDESSAFKTHSFSEYSDMCLDCNGVITSTLDSGSDLCYRATTNQTIAAMCVACWDANTCYE